MRVKDMISWRIKLLSSPIDMTCRQVFVSCVMGPSWAFVVYAGVNSKPIFGMYHMVIFPTASLHHNVGYSGPNGGHNKPVTHGRFPLFNLLLGSFNVTCKQYALSAPGRWHTWISSLSQKLYLLNTAIEAVVVPINKCRSDWVSLVKVQDLNLNNRRKDDNIWIISNWLITYALERTVRTSCNLLVFHIFVVRSSDEVYR